MTAPVDLTPFWAAWQAIQQEHARLPEYTAATEFWASYDAKLRASSALLSQARKDMELNTQWSNPGSPNAASTAFYGRVDAGAGSIQRWLDGDPAGVRQELATLTGRLDADFRTVDEHRNWLLGQNKVVGFTLRKITDQDRGLIQVEQGSSGDIVAAVQDAVRLRDELTRQFEKVRLKLEALPHNQKWLGPTTLAAPTSPGPAGPGGALDAPGPTAPGPNAPGPNAPGPADAPSPDKPAGPPSSPTAAPNSPPSPGVDKPGADPGPSDPGPTSTKDPILAGTPTPTMTPPHVTPLPGIDPSPRIPTGVPNLSGGPPNLTSPVIPPLTPIGTNRDTPSPAGSPARATQTARNLPPPPGQGVGVPEASPVLSRGGPPPIEPAGGRTGAGFYPPMMPPMYPGSGGGSGGVRPGEAESAGGFTRHRSGRDTWLAGLRPQLRGRAGGHPDDEPHDIAPLPAVGDVLDEELWQVPDATPRSPDF